MCVGCGLFCEGITMTALGTQFPVSVHSLYCLRCLVKLTLTASSGSFRHTVTGIKTSHGNIKAEVRTQDSGFRGTSNSLGLEASFRKTTK